MNGFNDLCPYSLNLSKKTVKSALGWTHLAEGCVVRCELETRLLVVDIDDVHHQTVARLRNKDTTVRTQNLGLPCSWEVDYTFHSLDQGT